MPILIPLVVRMLPSMLTDRRQREQRAGGIGVDDVDESIDDPEEEEDVFEDCEL